MNNSSIYYSVGALLYSPANNEKIVSSIMNQKFGTKYSLALCLEDTIRDDCVADAEQKLVCTIRQLHMQMHLASNDPYIPKIFVRVRNPQQISRLYKEFGEHAELVTGFIIPKFSCENADDYIRELIRINETAKAPVYAMPIYENAAMADLRNRYDILYTLKDKLRAIEDRILNIRVGGNDLCHLFGFRRHADESIHRIKPVADIFSDIITVYGTDYIISGPVWEYYHGENWKQGLANEIADDRLCGFIGKTVIHPNQIAVVNDSYKVTEKDYKDACSILEWDSSSPLLVAGCSAGERMNECKTHSNWALRTLHMAEAFGIVHNATA